MNNSKNEQIPKDREEAEKFYGDKTNTQHKEGNLDKAKEKAEKKGVAGEEDRKKSNVLTHPKDKDDESFDVDHNEKKSMNDK